MLTGVLELLDKVGENSFSIDDMSVLSMFANQAAVAIEQSRMHESLVPLIVEVLQGRGGITGQSSEELQQRSLDFITTIEESPAYHNAMEFAKLIFDKAKKYTLGVLFAGHERVSGAVSAGKRAAPRQRLEESCSRC